MKVSKAWLSEFVHVPKNAEDLLHRLTMAGLEVDSASPVAHDFTNVVVAKVLDTSPHPDADKLTICEVDCGENEKLQIVCGAKNVRANLMVPLAKVGALLPGGFKIKPAKLRGQSSNGMICSASELGLQDSSEGIMELPDDAPLGMDFRKYLKLDDVVLDIDLTPNRADCLSVLGIAREIAALSDTGLENKTITPLKNTIATEKKVNLHAVDACPKYLGCVIEGIDANATTPMWLIEALRRSGIRSIHPVVDVTNYVMLELGQPMHAFDLEAISGDINVRFSKKDERITLLDDSDVILAEPVLVIADDIKPLAIAGVMGGRDSGVGEVTKNILLESAYFNPKNIAGVARTFNLCTDSSQRFERGIDYELQERALMRATELLLTIVGGKAGPVFKAIKEDALPRVKAIDFNPEKVVKLTGVDVPLSEMEKIFKSLGMQVERTSEIWSVTPPSYRVDINIDVDLVEEIIRINGYDKIEDQKFNARVATSSPDSQSAQKRQLANILCNRGYQETISYSFVDERLQSALFVDAKQLALLNPISTELSHMRVSLWPGLIASLIHNIHRQQSCMKLFETGVTFIKDEDDNLQEVTRVAGLITGTKGEFNWCDTTRKLDFYDIKGDIESLCAAMHIDKLYFSKAKHSALHPGKTADIYIDEKKVGIVGALHPELQAELDLEQEVLLFEIDVSYLLSERRTKYQPVSKFPQIRRDLSFLLDLQVEARSIEDVIKKVVPKDVFRSLEVFDLYSGKGVPEGKKSLGVSICVQDKNKTLVDENVNVIIAAIIKELQDKFAIILRE